MLNILHIFAMFGAAMIVSTEVYAVGHQSGLDEEFVERGTVVKFPVPLTAFWREVARAILFLGKVKNVKKITAIAFLRVEKGAKIANHPHNKDCERYYLLTWRGILKLENECRIGSSHGWANTLPKNAILFTIKWE